MRKIYFLGREKELKKLKVRKQPMASRKRFQNDRAL